MTTFYTGVMVLTVLVMLILAYLTKENPVLSMAKRRQFTLGYCFVIIGAVFEWGSKWLEVNTGLVFVHLVVKTVELVVAPLIPVLLLAGISEDNRFTRPMFGIACANAVVEVLSAIFGFVFYVDSANVYHHGQFYWIYMACYIIECIYVIIAAVLMIRSFPNNRVRSLILVVIFLFVGIALQNLDSSIRVDYLTIAVALLLFYLLYSDILLNTDTLTRLSNRTTYSSAVNQLDENCAIINIDVDYFKQCNDTYGHSYGDKCLAIIGELIRTSFAKKGDCFRTGGDEFCVILRKGYLDIDNLLSEFHESIGERRKIEPSLPFVSTGYSFYYAGDSVSSAIEKADAMMYEFKNTRKHLWEEGKQPSYSEILAILTKK